MKYRLTLNGSRKSISLVSFKPNGIIGITDSSLKAKYRSIQLRTHNIEHFLYRIFLLPSLFFTIVEYKSCYKSLIKLTHRHSDKVPLNYLTQRVVPSAIVDSS